MEYKNKYGIEMSKELLIQYYDYLISGYYKALNIYEGRDYRTRQVIYSREEACEQFHKYIENFIIEICGGYYLFNENVEFLKLITILEGLLLIKVDEHKKVKSLIFGCINIINKIKERIKNGV